VGAGITLNRRAFLQAALAAAGGGVGLQPEPDSLAIFRSRWSPDQDPGASWAGVVNYIDRQLCGPFQSLREGNRLLLAGFVPAERSQPVLE
jgi:hypothetical protein